MGIVEATYAELKQQELQKNPYSCLHMADIDINPHQVEAFTFVLSSLESGGAILADEVGLGKTIEAGLVIKYLLQSGRDKILLIMPSNLRKQWQVELEEKFDITSLIVDSANWDDYLTEIKKKQSVIIVSYHFADKRKEYLGKVAWDFCVFDEAHRLRNVHKSGSKMANGLYELTKGIPKILLTATPMQNTLFYRAAKQYNPDFLVEAKDKKYMIEVKAANQTETEEVQEKAKAAVKWCECASKVDADGKVWEYRLFPGDKIVVGNTLKYVIGLAVPISVEE